MAVVSRSYIHPIGAGDAAVRSLQNRPKCKADEFFEDSAIIIDDREQTKMKRMRSRPQIHLYIMILGIGYLIILYCSSARQRTLYLLDDGDGDDGASVRMIRKADKADVVQRLQKLADETQQDVIVNLFTPVESSSTLNSITCATQGGVNKLSRLRDMTSRWLGPVSFSTLISSESDLDVLFQFWTANTLLHQYVSIHILMELPQLQRPENGRYPINQLRNLAIRNVKTDYVFITDVDFMPSDHAHDEISAIIKASPLSPKTFWVLPAFERYKNIVNASMPEEDVTDVAMIPKTKVELLKAIHQDNVVTTFHHYFPKPHTPTNFEKWYTYNDTSTAMYPIVYDNWFEPYVVCKTQDLHQYFPIFRGYGRNKNSFFIEANLRNFTFYVLSGQFVVHMNHQRQYERGQQDRSHLSPMMSAFMKYLKNTYNMPDDENYYFNRSLLVGR